MLFLLDDDEDEIHHRRVYQPRITFNLPNSSFREAFRVDMEVVERVEHSIGFELQRNTLRSHALTPREEILLAFHFFGNGAQYHINGHLHGVNRGTVCRSIHRVCYLITRRLMPLFIRWPTNSRHIDQLFQRKAGFPNVKGIIDGTLIHIDAPSRDEPTYVSRDNKHAMNVVIVCGPKHEFYFISAKCPGSYHDSRCLRVSNLWLNWDVHGWRPDNNYRSIILGDSGYPLRSWLITPIVRNVNIRPHLRNGIRSYLERHRKTRFIVECSIGIWKEQFPCLNHLRIRDPVRISNLIYATATLHNMQNFFRHGSYDFDERLNLIAHRDFEDFEHLEEIEGDGEGNRFADIAATNKQLQIIEYFNNI